jgi:hypothetical protein
LRCGTAWTVALDGALTELTGMIASWLGGGIDDCAGDLTLGIDYRSGRGGTCNLNWNRNRWHSGIHLFRDLRNRSRQPGLHLAHGLDGGQPLPRLAGTGLGLIGLGSDRPGRILSLAGPLLGATRLGLQGLGGLLRLLGIPFGLLQPELRQARLGSGLCA